MNSSQQEQFLAGVINCDLRVRQRIAPGDPVPFRYEVSPRSAGVSFRFAIRTKAFSIDGTPWPESFDRLQEIGASSPDDRSSYWIPKKLRGIPAGQHVAKLKLAVTLYASPRTGSGSTTWGGSSELEKSWGTALHQKTIEFKCPFEVLGQEPPDYIRKVHDPDWAKILLDCIGLTGAGFDWDEFWKPEDGKYHRGWASHSANFKGPQAKLPTNVAADVYLRIDGVEYLAGTAHGSKGEPLSVQIFGFEGRREPFKSFDLVLRPNEKTARESLDMYEMWDDVIVKPGMEAYCKGGPGPAATKP